MSGPRHHWNDVYAKKATKAVSWYQRHASRSLAFVTASAGWATPIIDIGGGASTLVDSLLERGFADVSVLDISEVALARAKDRLGEKASRVTWMTADVTRWHPPRQYGVWHDRAVFHFLTEIDDQDAYIAALRSGTAVGAAVIIATFALDGPDQCSGLPVQRYSSQTLAARLGAPFVLTDQAQEAHTTPWGTTQNFSYAVFRRAP